MTAFDVKQKFIEHLMEMDLNKLNVADLSFYAGILRTLDEMEKPSYTEAMASLLSQVMPVCGKKESEVECDG